MGADDTTRRPGILESVACRVLFAPCMISNSLLDAGLVGAKKRLDKIAGSTEGKCGDGEASF